MDGYYLRWQTFIITPDALHSVPVQSHARQLAEGLAYIEIAERRYLKTGHIVPDGVHLGLFGGHLPLEGQMQAVPHQDLWNARGVLLDLLEPTIDAVETPFIGYIVY